MHICIISFFVFLCNSFCWTVFATTISSNSGQVLRSYLHQSPDFAGTMVYCKYAEPSGYVPLGDLSLRAGRGSICSEKKSSTLEK